MDMSSMQVRARGGAIAVAALMAMTVVSGCHKKSSGTNPNSLGPTTSDTSGVAPTATLSADPVAIDLGQTVVLNWRTQNATTVTIDGIGPVNNNGTQTVSPSNSTNFHLTAKGDGGECSRDGTGSGSADGSFGRQQWRRGYGIGCGVPPKRAGRIFRL